MAKTKARCLNWSPDKGDPLTYHTADIEHVWPEIKFAGPLTKPSRYWCGDEDAWGRAIKEIQKPKTGKQIAELYRGDPKQVHMDLWVQVEKLLHVSPEQASELVLGGMLAQLRRRPQDAGMRLWSHLPRRELVAFITYPLLDKMAVVGVPTFERIVTMRYDRRQKRRFPMMTVGWFLWCVAQAYQHVYERWQEFGVYGHAIEDLMFESLTVDGNHVHLDIGS